MKINSIQHHKNNYNFKRNNNIISKSSDIKQNTANNTENSNKNYPVTIILFCGIIFLCALFRDLINLKKKHPKI